MRQYYLRICSHKHELTVIVIRLQALAMALDASYCVVVQGAELRIDIVGGLWRTVFTDAHIGSAGAFR